MPRCGECQPRALKVQPKHQTGEEIRMNGKITANRSTYERLGVMITLVQEHPAWHQSAILRQTVEGKKFSHRRTRSSQLPAGYSRSVGVEGVGELQTQKMVVIEVRNPYRLRVHNARRGLQTAGRPDWSARNLHGNQFRFWQRTANRHQCAPRRDVDGGGKLQGILAVPVASSDKNRNGELQPCPLSLFLLRLTHVS